jgi:HTH-type transcriptional regulator/antitoxin HipB
MRLRTPTDLGAVIRDRRKRFGLGQAELARRVGVSRQWVIGVERGRARAELALVLRTLDELGIHLEAQIEDLAQKPRSSSDIDAIVAAARKGGG